MDLQASLVANCYRQKFAYLFFDIVRLKYSSIGILRSLFEKFSGLKKDLFMWQESDGAVSLGTFRDGAFCQFTSKEEPDGGLNLPRGDGGPLVAIGQLGSLSSDTLKQIINKGVHGAHSLGGDTGAGVDLLQHLIDVNGKGLLLVRFALRAILGSLSGQGRQEEQKKHMDPYILYIY